MVIEDFRGEIKLSVLLKMIDTDRHVVPRRNKGPTPIVARHIMIAGPMKPEQVYHNLHAEDKLKQLERRIMVIKHERRELKSGVPCVPTFVEKGRENIEKDFALRCKVLSSSFLLLSTSEWFV